MLRREIASLWFNHIISVVVLTACDFGSPEAACHESADCGPTETCIAGECVANDCTVDGSCPPTTCQADADDDGVCDDLDICTGDDASGDFDTDGTCDDLDVCPQIPRMVFQAEDAELHGPTVTSDRFGYHGAGYADFGDYVGETIVVRPTVETTGPFRLGVRYANADRVGAARPMDLSINGSFTATLLFEAPSPRSWETWIVQSHAPIELAVGQNVVELATTLDAGPNVDELVFDCVACEDTTGDGYCE